MNLQGTHAAPPNSPFPFIIPASHSTYPSLFMELPIPAFVTGQFFNDKEFAKI